MTFSPSQNHWTVDGYRERVTKEQAREVLMERPNPIKNGVMRKWKSEHVGAGVYEIWMSEKPYRNPTN